MHKNINIIFVFLEIINLIYNNLQEAAFLIDAECINRLNKKAASFFIYFLNRAIKNPV